MPSFITFGCWNNLFYKERCSSSDPCYRDIVIDALGNYTRFNAVTDIMISGDNYYQNKIKFEIDGDDKQYNQVIIDDIISGFSQLRKAVPDIIPIHMVYGNHDLLSVNESFIIEEAYSSNEYNKDNLPRPTEDEYLDKCVIRDVENSAAARNDIKLGFNYFSVYGKHTLVLMIDTSIYSDEFEKIELCYDDSSNQEDLRMGQNSAVMEFIGEHLHSGHNHSHSHSHIKNIIVIGHHPIVYRKFKKGKKGKDGKKDKPGSNIVNYEPKLAELFVQINGLLSGQQIHYLCADFHVFAKGVVTITGSGAGAGTTTVNQYIVGTGGAKLDVLPKEGVNDGPFTDGIRYEPISGRSEHGFLVCNDNETGDFTFEFIGIGPVIGPVIGPIIGHSHGKGKKRKTNKRRSYRYNSKSKSKSKSKSRRRIRR